MIIYPLKPNWKLKDGYDDHFNSRVQSEDLFTWSRRFPLIKEVKGRAGAPKPQEQQLSYLW